MKYIKLFENYQSESEVAEICKKFDIKNWSLVDGLVNVDGGVDLSMMGLTELPLKFGRVTGSFDCAYNKLTSLEGCPRSVGGNFDCEENKLTSLVGCPRSVGGTFYCRDNKIREFTGIKYIGGLLFCSRNPIKNIWHIISPTLEWDEDQMDLFEDLSVIQDDGEAVAIERLNFFLEEIGRPTVEKVRGYINLK